jgi:hypothetical protein
MPTVTTRGARPRLALVRTVIPLRPSHTTREDSDELTALAAAVGVLTDPADYVGDAA